VKRHLATLAIAVALTFVAATAWAYLSAGSVPGGSGAAAASSVNQGATPTASVTGSTVTVSWTATTLANGQAVSGYLVKRYDAGTLASQTILSACTGTIAATSCVESGVPNGSWKYTVTPVLATNWQGPESAKSATVVVNADVTAPTNSISLSSVTGGAFLNSGTVYYRGTSAGSLRLTNAVADAGSGPASSATAALGGTTTNWTHAPSTVSAPTGGPYVSTPFSWTAGTSSAPSESVTGRDVAGNSAVTGLTFTNDSTAPTPGTISYPDGASGQSVSISLTTGTDAGSGIATRRLQRATAPLSGGTCGSWSGFAAIGADGPTSPYVDGSLAVACYKYRYVVTDRVGNQDIATSSSVVKVGYGGSIGATPGLLSHWRLGDSPTVPVTTSSDSFTDTSGTLLTVHTGELAATWTRVLGTANATVSNEGRILKANTGYAVDRNALVQATPDYSVEADVVDKSVIADDAMGVIGRLNASNTFYLASWEERDNSWNLALVTNGTIDYLDYVPNQPALVIGQTYRIKLEMIGSALKLYVNGVLKVSVTDTTLTTAGRAGIMTGRVGTSAAQSNTTGLHLDNFQVSTTSRALDSKGDNHGAYVNGVTRGVAGALPGDADTAASFDGTNDDVQVLNSTGIPVGSSSRSVEAWFKTSSAARQVIFGYGTAGANQEFGLWINAGGASMTAWGGGGASDKTFTLASAVNNGAWHHVVITYDGTTLVLYVDGVALPSQAATRNTTIDAYGFGIGAVINPGIAGSSGGYFNGSIDEVALYASVLDQATVTAHYLLGGAPVGDTSGPAGGSVDASGLVGTGGRYATSTTLSLVLATGTDTSGIAATGNQLLRATAPMTAGSCGTFGSYGLVADDPTTPTADTVADAACYRYQYVVNDTLGNPTTYTSPDIKVDVAAVAAPALALSNPTNVYVPGSGSTAYYRSAAASGSVRFTATATAPSGIASYAFPALGAGWTATPGATGVTTYSWSAASPAAPGTKSVTATNNAGATSATAPFTLTADDAAPTGSALSYLNGSTTSTSVSVTLANGTDSGSGLGTRLLQRQSATLSGATCGSYGAFATVGTNPTSPVADAVTAGTTGTCYRYQYVVADNLGNQVTVTSPSVVKVIPTYSTAVDNTTGLVNWWRLGEGSGTTAADSQGSSGGTYTGGPTLGAAGAIAGDANTGIQLDGVNDLVTATANVTTNFSIEFWFRSSQGIGSSSSWTDGAGLVSGDRAGTANDFGISLLADGRIVGGIGTTSIVSSTGGWNDGGWHHVVLTRAQTGPVLVLYVDGASVATGTGPTGNLGASAALAFGRIQSGANNYLQGALDEVAFYNAAISAATVTAHYTTGTTP
jgi:hypothetical protein